MKLTLLLTAFSCLVILPLQAQETAANASGKPELPPGPLLRPAAEFSQWVVSYTYPDDKKKDASGKAPPPGANLRLSKTLTTKTGRIVHEQQTDVQNRVTDVWFNGSTQYTKSGTNPTWFEATNLVVGGTLADGGYNPLPASGFRNLDWITEANFAGTVPYGKATCLVFVPGGYQKLNLNDVDQRQKRMEAADQIAFIDADTRMPIAVRTRSELRAYHFDPPPTEVQQFPGDLADQVKKGNEARARLTRPAERPY